MDKIEYLGDIDTYTPVNGIECLGYIELLLGECECGYHFTVDATYVEQVSDFEMVCPACKKVINTADVFKPI